MESSKMVFHVLEGNSFINGNDERDVEYFDKMPNLQLYTIN